MFIHFFTGISASVLHVISGPDHLAAVTPLALRSRLKAWLIGLFWGLGHTIGALTIGGLFLLMRDLIPIESISHYSEQIVGGILILIGAWAIWKMRKPHDYKHTHEVRSIQSVFIAMGIGVIHGLAGLSHLIGVLPTLALPTRTDAIIYLGGFATGTILAMVSYAVILGLITHRSTEKRKFSLFRQINFAGGLFAILVGIYWISTTMAH